MNGLMTAAAQVLNYMTNLLTWWVVISPWEQAIRVRLGKRIALLNAGIYLRIPLVDKIYIQSTRLRMMSTHTQTLTTRDKKLVTVGAALSYSIKDILKLYLTMHYPEETLRNLVAGAIARVVTSTDAADLNPAMLGREATSGFDFSDFGLEASTVQITDFAFTRAYRLIQDGRGVYYGGGPDVNSPQA